MADDSIIEGDIEPKDKNGEITIDTRRHLFNIGCKNSGVSQDTCLALTLLLQSKEELGTMVRWMIKQENQGCKSSQTEVVLIAEKIKDYYLAHPEEIKG